MPYQSRRQQGGSKEQSSNNSTPNYDSIGALDAASQRKKDREEANKKALKTTAKGVGAYLGGPLGAKAADALANTKKGQKILDKGAKKLNRIPGVGRAADKLNKSGALDAADKGMDLLGGKGKVPNNLGGGQAGSLPSSSVPDKKTSGSDSGSGERRIAGVPRRRRKSFLDEDNKKNEDESNNTSLGGKFFGSIIVKIAVFIFAPFLFFILMVFMVVSSMSGIFSDYEDAFGISQTVGEETGNVYFTAKNEEQQGFYDRINNVKLSYQASGKSVDPLKVVAVYYVLNKQGASLSYSDMNEGVIREIADAMFDGNSYSEDVFKNNLINNFFPKYVPNASQTRREQMAEEVFNYIDRYYSLIGKDTSGGGSCASIGSCAYDIKGFYLPGGGNVAKSMQIKDLKVRLMECGAPYGNGTYGKPIDQDLVNFEDYVAGVAYAEVGSESDIEVLKAQMVVARSFALSRPTAMNNGLGKKLEEENGQWILQITSCVADQVFCNIDEGCSFMGGGDGQGGIVRSGKISGALRTREPIPADHKLRKAAAETQGEVLVNSQGYIINSGYLNTEQMMFANLANQGLNYKQILLQVYNQGARNYGASDIKKANCGSGSSSNCASTGDFANWKQCGASWSGVPMGASGANICDIGCLATSVAILVAKSGVPTNISGEFNPGTFVQYLNSHGGFTGGGALNWMAVTNAVPSFKYQGQIAIAGWSKQQKLNKLKEMLSDDGVYVVAEVKGGRGMHWVAIDAIDGNNILMMDPGTNATNLDEKWDLSYTSVFASFKVQK